MNASLRSATEGSPDAIKAHSDRIWSSLINCCVGFAAFFLTCSGLHAVLPFPEIEGVSHKLRYFAEHKDEFDTLFIGSSRVYIQIAPKIFDRVTREHGFPTSTFNFGIGGMFLPESAFVLDQILRMKPLKLKWVFIEFDEMHLDPSADVPSGSRSGNGIRLNEGSRRELYWHDWKRTSLILRNLMATKPQLSWRLEKIWGVLLGRKTEANTQKLSLYHFAQFEKDFANVSRGFDLLALFSRRDVDKNRESHLGPATDGYIALTKKMAPAEISSYERAFAEAMKQGGKRIISSYELECCRQSAEKVARIGATPIFLVPPTMAFKFVYEDNCSPPGIVMFFSDPHAYPDLYRSNMRMDGAHLTKEGGENFTRLIACDFVRLMRTSRAK